MQEYLLFAHHRQVSLNDVLDLGYNEFLEYRLATKLKWLEKSKQDFYLAQIAFVMAKTNADKDSKLCFEDFIFDFKDEKPMTPEERMQASINAWELVTGKKAK